MKYEITSDYSSLSMREVVDQLYGCGAIEVEPNEKIGEFRLECGTDLEVDIMYNEPDDPRIDGGLARTETFTIPDICEWFTESDAYAWALDEDGCETLLCLNNY